MFKYNPYMLKYIGEHSDFIFWSQGIEHNFCLCFAFCVETGERIEKVIRLNKIMSSLRVSYGPDLDTTGIYILCIFI